MTNYFTEENSAETVINAMSDDADPRLREVMSVVIRKLHEAVKEIEPSQDEWMAAIQFLTATGQKCDEWRQEYILASDTLGVSMLVDAINSRRPSGATENTVLGPFHVANVPESRWVQTCAWTVRESRCSCTASCAIWMARRSKA